MQNSWLALLPPLLVLFVAFLTKRVLSSLLLGIVAASLIAGNFTIWQSAKILANRLFEQFDLSNIYIFIFLSALGILITLISFTGGMMAYSNIIQKRINEAKNAETASLFLSFLLLFDDFFSSITTGCIMRPLTDHFKIPRVKLAFLIDAMASPLVILVPFSSWIAMLTMQLTKAGISLDMSEHPLVLADPLIAYLKIIPFIFYSFILIPTVLLIVRKKLSFGTMRKHELIAQKTGNLFGGKVPISDNLTNCCTRTGTLTDFLLPLGTLLSSIFAMLLYAGNFYLLGGTNTFMQALQTTDIFFALCFGSLFTLAVTIFYYLVTRKLSASALPQQLWIGANVMASSIVILFFAWTFSSLIINDLNTGSYLAHVLGGKMPLFLLPAFFFVLSAVAAIAIGSSWGTIAVMSPLATPLVIQMMQISTPTTLEFVPLLLPVFGAIFAGAVAGDHISPLASTTLMSSTSSGCYHIDHVQSQLEYATPVLIATTIAYIIAGLTVAKSYWLSFALAFIISNLVCLISFYTLHYVQNKK